MIRSYMNMPVYYMVYKLYDVEKAEDRKTKKV